MVDMRHRQHLWVTSLALAKKQKTLHDNVAALTFPSALGAIRRPPMAGLGTLSPLEGRQRREDTGDWL